MMIREFISYLFKEHDLFLLFVIILSTPLSLLAQFTEINTNLPNVGISSAAWGDYDNDGDLDILLTGYEINIGVYSRVYRNNGNSTFTDIYAGLTPVQVGSVAWGDYDNDGDLDILLTGRTIDGVCISKIYRNNGNSTFTDINAGLTGVCYSSVAWGDYDNDGDLDILLTGAQGVFPNYNQVSKIYRNNGNSTFSSITVGLIAVHDGSVAWGDYDNDGDLDILLTGQSTGYEYNIKIYRNNGNNTFTEIAASQVIVSVAFSSVAWGDYDNDGDLDILITGGGFSLVYRNNGNSTFTNIGVGLTLTGVDNSSAAWGDYDNDGDLDILLTGYVQSDSTRIAKVFRNNGNSTFTNIGANLTGVSQGSVAWGDYDNDGDLDILLTGCFYNYNNNSWINLTKVYRNDITVQNTIPTVPSNLRLNTVGDYINFQWNAATDTQTPASGLNYTVRVGSTPGGNQISASMSNTTGYRLIPVKGNANGTCSWKIAASVLSNYNKFYWSVQAIDGAYAGSEFASEAIYQSIRVIAPYGGENWQTNSAKTVYWTAQPAISQVNILLSTNNGANWNTLNTSPVSAALGRFSFTVPSTVSNQCRIKVISTANNNLFDTSVNVFSISSNPGSSLSLTAPTNTKLQAGNIYNITWIANGIQNIKLEYTLDAGLNWNSIVSSLPASNGTYTWTVPNTPAATCYLRISGVTNPTVYDWSDEPFCIYNLQLTSPNGGNLFQAGSSQNITWSSAQIANVKLEYSQNNGSNWTQIIASTGASTGTYSWSVPNLAASQYIIRISDTTDSTINDFSDNIFTVVLLNITYPSAPSTKLRAGNLCNITWNQQGLSGTVKLELTTNNGSSYTSIATGINVSEGTYSWLIPDISSLNCKIRITSELYGLILDSSDNNFTICRLILNTPNGSEIWSSGSVHTISWTSIYILALKLEYSLTNSNNWIQIAPTISASLGSYSWTVPAVNSNLCRVRISDVTFPQILDISDTTFTIQPSINVIAPNGGEYLVIGNVYHIQWNAIPDISSVSIVYSVDNGASWIPIQASSYPASAGSYEWVIPNTTSTQCRMKVQNFANNNVYDTSDSVFTISDGNLAPIAQISADITSGNAPLTVHFTDQSIHGSCPITSWDWDFGDNTPHANTQNPTHLYANRGIYSVSLSVSGANNISNSITAANLITLSNQAPYVSEPLPDIIVNEDFATIFTNLSSNFTDNDGDILTYSVSFDSTTIHASIVNNTLELSSLPNVNGHTNIIITANDNYQLERLLKSSNSKNRDICTCSFSVTINPINDPPQIISYLPTQTTFTVVQNETQNFSINALDIDSQINYHWYINNVDQSINTNEFAYQFTQNDTYQVKAVAYDSISSVEQLWTVTATVENNDPQVTPLETRMYTNYPNPFNPETTIRYSLKSTGWVNISVYDIKGQLLRILTNSNQKPGRYHVIWNGRDNHNDAVASGIYYIQMKTNEGNDIRKITLIK